ncbi:MAG: enoyl-CoA hydratase [bacterium]|nr:enoyl-CoA hydratase [bacterium]
MDYEHIVLGRDRGRARITLNRPDRRNAMSLELLTELDAVLQDLGSDRSIRVVIIEGAGPVFSAGHDLAEMIDRDGEFYDELFGTCTNVMLRVQAIPQPVIAKVHGVATAAGCQLVAACDLAVATEDSRFATPGVKIGLFCSTPMVPVSRVVGRKRALEMLLTGDPIDAMTAREWGLVNRVVPGTELEAATVALAQSIEKFSRDTIAIGKSAFYRQVDQPQSTAYATAGPIMSQNARNDDAQEGMGAFLEKRPPVWND